MKINFKVPLTGLEGPVLDEKNEPIYLNKSLAELLGRDPHTSTGINYMDALEYAIAINKGEVIDLTTDQQEKFKKFISESPLLTAFAKRDLLAAMDKKEQKN